jgi:hypothetical protein
MNKDYEIFQRVEAHLLTQNAKSVGSVGFCMYRGEHNRSCAVGCLILDEYYNLGLEGRGVLDNQVVHALRKSGIIFGENTLKMLKGLQRVHDNTAVESWKLGLMELKRSFFN